MDLNLTERGVIVTGASKGLGRAAARALAAEELTFWRSPEPRRV